MNPDDRPLSPEEILEHTSFLRRVAYGLCAGDAHGAEDLVQDAWVRALEKPPADRGALRGWLATVLRRRALNRHRAEARRSHREAGVARPESQDSHEEALEGIELSRVVFDAVRELKEEQRTVLYLRYYRDLAPREIAARLDVPVKTVKSRLARALSVLRETLDRRHGGRRDAWMTALLPLALPAGGVPSPLANAAPTAGGSALAGGSLMKLALVTAGAVGLAFTLWQAGAWGGGESAPREAGAVQARRDAPAPDRRVAAPEEPGRRAALPVEPTPERRDADPPRGGLEVLVRWADGTPAADIGLSARCAADPAPRDERVLAVTDARGKARFPALFAGDVRVFTDRGSDLDAVVDAGETAEVTHVLPEGEVVVGRVLDVAGGPVADAELWIQSLGRTPRARRVARAQADGSFVLRGVGEYVAFGARAPGYRPSVLLEAAVLPVDGDGRRTVDLLLEAGGETIGGVVRDPTGRPVAGARVLVGPPGGHIVDLPSGLRGEAPTPVPVVTDDDGRFAYPGAFEAGSLPVHATARGFPNLSTTVEVDGRGTSELELVLQAPATIVGRVLGLDGAPAAGARVVAAVEDRGGWYHDLLPPSVAHADAQGRFELRWIAPGLREVNASVPRRGRAGKAQARVVCAPGETVEVELALDRGAVIEGVVRDGAGNALVGWGVWGDPVRSGFVYPRQDRTDEQGRFVLANLGDSAWNLRVAPPGELPLPPRATASAVPRGVRDLELVVDASQQPDAWVRGNLVDVDGRVPRDVQLTIGEVGSGRGFFVELDPDTGDFLYGPTLAGTYALEATRGGLGNVVLAGEPFELARGATHDVGNLRLEPQGRLVVRVAGLPASALGDLELHLNRADCGTETLEPRDGRFVSAGLVAGTWVLTAREGPWLVRAREVTVVSGEETELVVEAVRGQPVAFVLRVEPGLAELADVSLALRDEHGHVLLQRTYFELTFDEGRRRLAFLVPPGTHTLSVRSAEGAEGAATVEVPAGGQPPPEVVVDL